MLLLSQTAAEIGRGVLYVQIFNCLCRGLNPVPNSEWELSVKMASARYRLRLAQYFFVTSIPRVGTGQVNFYMSRFLTALA